MPLGVNLRGDLAKLSNAELVQRLSEAWKDYEEAESRPGPKLVASARGPIRQPLAYWFFSFIGIRDGWTSYFGTALPRVPSKWFARGNRPIDMHRALCEIQDIHDEIECRIGRKPTS